MRYFGALGNMKSLEKALCSATQKLAEFLSPIKCWKCASTKHYYRNVTLRGVSHTSQKRLKSSHSMLFSSKLTCHNLQSPYGKLYLSRTKIFSAFPKLISKVAKASCHNRKVEIHFFGLSNGVRLLNLMKRLQTLASIITEFAMAASVAFEYYWKWFQGVLELVVPQ